MADTLVFASMSRITISPPPSCSGDACSCSTKRALRGRVRVHVLGMRATPIVQSTSAPSGSRFAASIFLHVFVCSCCGAVASVCSILALSAEKMAFGKAAVLACSVPSRFRTLRTAFDVRFSTEPSLPASCAFSSSVHRFWQRIDTPAPCVHRRHIAAISCKRRAPGGESLTFALSKSIE